MKFIEDIKKMDKEMQNFLLYGSLTLVVMLCILIYSLVTYEPDPSYKYIEIKKESYREGYLKGYEDAYIEMENDKFLMGDE